MVFGVVILFIISKSSDFQLRRRKKRRKRWKEQRDEVNVQNEILSSESNVIANSTTFSDIDNNNREWRLGIGVVEQKMFTKPSHFHVDSLFLASINSI